MPRFPFQVTHVIAWLHVRGSRCRGNRCKISMATTWTTMFGHLRHLRTHLSGDSGPYQVVLLRQCICTSFITELWRRTCLEREMKEVKSNVVDGIVLVINQPHQYLISHATMGSHAMSSASIPRKHRDMTDVVSPSAQL